MEVKELGEQHPSILTTKHNIADNEQFGSVQLSTSSIEVDHNFRSISGHQDQ